MTAYRWDDVPGTPGQQNGSPWVRVIVVLSVILIVMTVARVTLFAPKVYTPIITADSVMECRDSLNLGGDSVSYGRCHWRQK